MSDFFSCAMAFSRDYQKQLLHESRERYHCTVGMSQNAGDSIESVKNFLLKYNPSKIGPDNQTGVLDQFVRDSQRLFTFFQKKTSGISDSTGLLATDTFSIWILRTSQVVCNKKIDSSGYIEIVKEEILTAERSTVIFDYVVDFWMHGNPAFTNALKELFTKLLHLLRLIHPATECDRLFSSWLEKTFQLPSDLPVQYYLIEALAGELDLYPVLHSRPDFVEKSLTLIRSDLLSNPIGKSISRVLINVFHNHFNKDLSQLPGWLAFWQKLVEAQLGDSRCRKAIELYILHPVFKEMPSEAFTAFVERITSKDPSVLLSVLKVGQELGIEEEPFRNNRLIRLDTIGSLLKVDELKLAAFELLTFSTKKSLPINSYVFDLIRENLTVFFVDTRIEVRNYFCSAFKNLIYRIRDSAHSLHKSASSLKRANKFPTEQKMKFDYVQECQSFLEWLLDFLKLQICPGTQYQRNDVALKLLMIIIGSSLDGSIPTRYLDMKNSRSYPFSIPVFRDSSLIRLLLDCLASNFSDIRQTAKKLLSMALEGSDAKFLIESINWSHLKSQSDSFMSQYQYSDVGAALESVRFCAEPDKIAFITRMVNILHDKVNFSKEDFAHHIHEPISGYLTSLALILEESELDDSAMKPIIAKCVEIVFINWGAIKHVICHESCEENLWMMYPDGDVDAQLVLSTAFRITKESSVLLRVLLSRYSLSSDQLTTIGDFLINQLFDIRHSGAFQSVTPTFTVLCLRSKREKAGQLKKWLKIILDSIQVKTQNVTRRSGGIPLMLAVILSAESGKERPLLKYAFERLIKIASTNIEEHQDKLDLPQVNAFNCIKAIFTESKLSQACDPYTSSALSLALKNFDSHTWALRNCSIMLFTSLQNRLFGKRGKSVSARMFFTRYPGIREDLLEILQRASRKTEEQSQIESTFLGLSILLRLKPTPGYRGLDVFNSELQKILESSNWKIRELAARCLSSLAEDPIQISRQLIERISTKSQNSLHGSLLAIREMVTAVRTFEFQQVESLFLALYDKVDDVLSQSTSFLTIKTYISLMANVMELTADDIYIEQQTRVINSVARFFKQHSKESAIDGSKRICLATALGTLLKFCKKEQLVTLLEQGIQLPFYEVQETALEYLSKISSTPPQSINTLITSINSLVVDNSVPPTVNFLSLKALNKLNVKIETDLLLSIIEKPRSESQQLAAIESLGNSSTNEKIIILEEVFWKFSADEAPLDFRIASLKSLMSYPDVTKNISLTLLLDRMLSDDDEDVRLTVASFLNESFLIGGTRDVPNPVEISRILFPRIMKSFSKDMLTKYATRMLKGFLTAFDLFAFGTRGDCVFETEKDNQFRNAFEQNMKYCELLHFSGYDDKFEVWLVDFKDKLELQLESTKIKDGPLGWASNGEVFSRLLLLRVLLKLIGSKHLHDFDDALIKCNIHPVILSQKYPDSVNLCSDQLLELSLS